MERLVLPDEVELNTVLDNLTEMGATIIPVDGQAAQDALRDQILVRGPATRKGGVKTGAADSAWLRSVLAHNNGSFD
jgi:hypothetical protein